MRGPRIRGSLGLVVSEISDTKGLGGLKRRSRTSRIRVFGLGPRSSEMSLGGSRPEMFSGFAKGGFIGPSKLLGFF
jgi:hypothetical protein